MKAIDDYTSHGGTALWDAVHESNGRLRTAEGRRVVVVMTDGRDENATANGPGSVTKYDDLLDGAARDRRARLRDRPRHQRRSRSAAGAGGRHRRGSVLPGDRRGAVGRVRAHRREPAPAVRHRLHLDQQPPRRRLAGGVGDQPPARCPHRQPRRLLRAAALTRAALAGPRVTARTTRCSTGAESTAANVRLPRYFACSACVPAARPTSRNSIWLATPWTRSVRCVDHGAVRDEGHLAVDGAPVAGDLRDQHHALADPRHARRQPQRHTRRALPAVGGRGRRRRPARRSAPASSGRAAAAPDRSARSGP